MTMTRNYRVTPTEERFALGLLAASDQGITEALAAAHGIRRKCLDKLVAAGKVRATDHVLAKPAGLKVTRYELVKP